MRLWTLPFLLALLALPPSASAQDPTLAVEVDPLPFPLKPLAETGRAEVRFTAPCGPPLVLTAEAPRDWVLAVVEPERPSAPGTCVGTWNGTAELRVRFTQDAPALEAWPVIVRAQAGEARASADVAVTPGFLGVLDVQANRTDETVEPQRPATFEVGVTNLGNGNTKVAFQVVQRSAALQVPEPVSITLQPGQRATVPITAMATPRNGANDQTEVFTLLLTSAHALHPDQAGDSETLSFTVRTQGLYAPGAPAWVAVVVGMALALWRRTSGAE